jgi:hypothetical protein
MVTGLAALMEAWRAETMYSSDADFIFPSIELGGSKPRTGGIPVTDYIHPAAVAADVLEPPMVFATTTESQCYGSDFIRGATDWPPGWPIVECIRV